MQHGVAGQGVHPCFGASLRIDHVLHIADLSEDVHPVELEGEPFLQDAFGERAVPYQMGSVERPVAVSPAAVECGVGSDLPVLRQIEQEVSSGSNVECRDVFERCTFRPAVEPGKTSLNAERVSADTVGER